jgi:class 3 adenylate cyclase/pimeloyl-ACP methyl ester carboxylesterase
MEPRIQYAKTSDGVNIAYYAMGQGTPFVCMNLPNSHLQMEWQMSDARQIYEATARLGTLVRYDHRGFGLSDRDVSDFSIEALLRDLQGVVDRLELKSFNLVAYGVSAPLAIAFSAAQPDRVLKLVLWPGLGRLPKTLTEPIEKLLALGASHWEFVTESVARLGLGWSDEMSGQAAATLRESVTRDTVLEFWRQAQEWDVTNLLHQVAAPTLLVQEKADKQIGQDIARELASIIPDARVALLDGASRQERYLQAAGAIGPFLFDEWTAALQKTAQLPTGTAAQTGLTVILFADIADSTGLTERLGDAAFRAKARELDAALRTVIRDHAGTPIEGKLLGDGVLAVFTSARQAIAAAQACGRAGDDGGLPLHLGLHAGDVIREDNNVYGGAVNIASRISGLSAPGEVWVSDIVRGLARTSAGVRFEDRGEQSLKGVGEAVRVWAVREGDV